MNEPTQDTQTPPRNGETLGAFVYHAPDHLWVYPAGYSDPVLCVRRAMSLNKSFGVLWFYAREMGGEYYAVADEHPERTAALRRAFAASPASPASPIWLDDTAAHVAETVDELRETGKE